MKHSFLTPLLLCGLLLCGARAASAQRNVVVIVVDQLSYWATDPEQRAPLALPNLDALAARGRRFTRAYTTSPVCSENRLALLSGQYPFALGTNKLLPGTPSLGVLLQAAGWETGYVGKWHLSPEVEPDPDVDPQYVAPANRPGWDLFSGKEGAPHRYIRGKSFRQDDPTPISTAPWEPAWNTEEALRFLAAERDRPFALVVNFDPPHPNKDHKLLPPPIYARGQITPRPNVDPAISMTVRPRVAEYLSKVKLTDEELGRLVVGIDLTTTFVVFTSDHGDLLYSHGADANQQKRRPWEEATHIPLIIAGPGIEAAEDARLISTVDLAATVFSLLELPLPAEFQGQALPAGGSVYLGHGNATNSWNGECWRALVDGEFKYAVTESGETELLYDLAADPYELRDLARVPAHEATLTAMRAAIRARAEAVGDPFFSR